MSRPLQAKLLRFLEDGTFTRVGGTQELRSRPPDCRHQPRYHQSDCRRPVREDLFHRLNVVQMRLRRCGSRGRRVIAGGLLPARLRHFDEQGAARPFRAPRGKKLLSTPGRATWPSCRNVIERALILEANGDIQPASLPDFQLEPDCTKRRGQTGDHGSLDEMMAAYERELITTLLKLNHFSLAKTAEQLKISRHALRYVCSA